jgi:hypothetical protein
MSAIGAAIAACFDGPERHDQRFAPRPCKGAPKHG